jgi:hypothetical protein
MIPPFLVLGAAKATDFIKAVPRWAWIALAVVSILLLGSCAHKRKVKAFGEERYAAGVAYEQARLEKKAKELKAKVDALSGKITTQLRTKHDEKVIVINRAADDLRLRGAGKASCSSPAGIPSGPSGSVAPSGQGSVAGPQVPTGDFAAVPWGWLVDRAEVCDLNRQEVLTWREWHRQQSEAWAKLK